ncbi:MAG: TetR/AcrR family transcriptional repressor of nem operon [Patiriisocius sp.]|jgi:TetR/AcrR family transcriptional repressor of nem operon
MVSSANARQQQKSQSRQKILDAASRRLRLGGPKNVGISAVSADAGLTHGGFYGHFSDKEELTVAAFNHALEGSQHQWFADADSAKNFDRRLAQLARSYLSQQHRDNPAQGCAIAALASYMDLASVSLKASYSEAIERTVQEIAEHKAENVDRAIDFLATLTGAINLARNTTDQKLSDQILRVTAARFARS